MSENVAAFSSVVGIGWSHNMALRCYTTPGFRDLLSVVAHGRAASELSEPPDYRRECWPGAEEFPLRGGTLAVRCHESRSCYTWGRSRRPGSGFFTDSVRVVRLQRLQGRIREPGLVAQLGSRSHGSGLDANNDR
jgi:hypothetical protein